MRILKPMLSLLVVISMLILPVADGETGIKSSTARHGIDSLGQYVVLGWNDLGMHCMNRTFNTFCILPPYNVMRSQVIRRGNPPQLVESAVDLAYRFPANTYSVGKVDFWNYSQALFGATLAPNIGLTGNGLAGKLIWNTQAGLFEVTGVPLTPYEDGAATVSQPYQFAEVTLSSSVDHAVLDQTTFVAPVSVEMHCNKCHSRAGMTTEEAILSIHEDVDGKSLLQMKPVLCASCHSSNALGTAGRPGLPSLSLALHGAHAEENPSPACYDCHPGQDTQCLRDAMYQAGKRCEDCHGPLAQVAQSVRDGRRPWLDEPSCASTNCHDANHGPEPGQLYRHSKGHGGLACEACHNSPHAILPTVQPRDAVQVQRVQGTSSYIKNCKVCHATEPLEAGPHGVLTSWRIANHLANKAPLTGSELLRADYTKDGKVDISDVIHQVNKGL